MKCEICGKEYRNLSSHIWQSHSIYSQEYYDKYLKKEGEGICAVCGKPTEFRGLGIGYSECCSIQCATKNPKRQEKIRETNLKKYGVPNPFLLPEVVEKAQKNSHTKEAIEKQWETKKHRYGINPLHTEETKAKAKKGIQRTIVARTASFEKRFADFEKENDCTRVSKLYKKYGQGWKKIKDDLDVITVGQYSFLKNFEIEKIIEYNLESRDALARSNIEDEVLSFIYDIFSEEIQTNIRSIISPQELDIYIPERKIAIEVDGIYWHSTNAGKDKNYHLHKTIECEKRGIQLIHITE